MNDEIQLRVEPRDALRELAKYWEDLAEKHEDSAKILNAIGVNTRRMRTAAKIYRDCAADLRRELNKRKSCAAHAVKN